MLNRRLLDINGVLLTGNDENLHSAAEYSITDATSALLLLDQLGYDVFIFGNIEYAGFFGFKREKENEE